VLCLPAALAVAAVGLSAVPPSAAQEPPPIYFVKRVTAQGGNPIQGVPGGVIHEREGCGSAATTAKLKAVAASLGADLQLEVEIGDCSGAAPPPAVQCTARIGEEASTARFEGWRGNVRVPLPRHTLLYNLQLDCSFAGGEGDQLAGALYLTYQPPRIPVRQPLEDWYRLACEWGAGLTIGDSESQVVESILRGLYGHGQRAWRYGYCTIEKGECRFGPSALPIDYPGLRLFPSVRLGRCNWSLLAAGDEQCNFTDCFGFSDMLHYIAGTMGIGGLVDEQVEGTHKKGFGTHGWLRAIDPRAFGNLECGYRQLGCSFLFGVHDLRRRDGVKYDATFGRFYETLGELVDDNILFVMEPIIISLDNSNACFLNGEHYGGFSPLLEVSKALLGCPFEKTPSASLGAMKVSLESVFGDQKPELLRIQLSARVQRRGRYKVVGVLVGGPDGSVLVDRPGERVTAVWPHAIIDGAPDTYTVSLYFSGEDVARAGSGPLRLNAAIVGDQGIAAELHEMLPSLSLEGLGEQLADLKEAVEAERVVLPDSKTALQVRVPVSVRDEGLFAVDARLSSGGKTIVYSGFVRELPQGKQELIIDFPGEAIARRGIDGLYEVTVELHLLDPATGYPLELTDSLVVPIGPFDAADFRS
jgi:hypothetical protein